MKFFNIIKGKKEYWLVDQIERDDIPGKQYQEQLKRVIDEWSKEEIQFISVLMDERYENWLIDNGFRKISSIVEYTRTLEDLREVAVEKYDCYSLDEGFMTDKEFGELYEYCRSGSANKNEKQSADQIMYSLENELGKEWRKNCYYFLMNKEVIGISIPHIEIGTLDEGRLFYFGVIPEMRGYGMGTKIHEISLSILKRILEATYYVGSTDIHNEHMIRIFENNGSVCRSRKGIFNKRRDD
ncbi:hypothetical protein ACFSTA_17145 [Ornithinibacillus salinisoli]|uniref:GNAT family N-acetyltransferase n=1 Tax=Ornithinibacillus salinisoli TaxID=1848459 RepID=A0ABW4W1W7_9BACI